MSNLLLLVPLSQYAIASDRFDLFLAFGQHELLVGVLVLLLTLSGSVGSKWRLQYAQAGLFFSVYVAARMSTRFLFVLSLINRLAVQGSSVSGAVPTLYLYGLASAASFTGMVLAMRRAYGKLASARTIALSP